MSGPRPERPYRPSRGTTAVCLTLLMLAVLGLRARGLGFGLPHGTHADARVLVEQIEALREGRPDPEGHRLYPHLVPRLAALVDEPGEHDLPPTAEAARHRARASGAMLRARWTSVLASIPLVLLTFLLARSVLGRGASLFAAALTGTSLLHQSFAQQARPHAALATATALAVLAAIWLRRRPSLARYAFAGGAAALAVGALHSGLAVLPAGLAAHLLRGRGSDRSAGPAGRRAGVQNLYLLVPVALVVAAVFAFYPFHFAGHFAGHSGGTLGDPSQVDSVQATPTVVQQGDESVLNLSGHLVKLESFDGSGFAEVAGAFWAYDPLLSALVALGLLMLLVRPPSRRGPWADGLVLAAYALPYLVAIGLYGKTPERFALPLTPFAAIVAARGAGLVAPHRAELAWGAAVLALALPTGLAWKLSSLRAAPDTYARAASLLVRQTGEYDRTALLLDPHQDLPLIQTREAAEHNAAWPWASPWALYLAAQPALPPGRDLRVVQVPGRRPADLGADTLGVLTELGADYALVELVPKGPRSRTQRAAHGNLVEGAQLVGRVSPLKHDTGGNERLFVRSVSFKRPMFLRILAARCTGPTLELFRLPTDAR